MTGQFHSILVSPIQGSVDPSLSFKESHQQIGR